METKFSASSIRQPCWKNSSKTCQRVCCWMIDVKFLQRQCSSSRYEELQNLIRKRNKYLTFSLLSSSCLPITRAPFLECFFSSVTFKQFSKTKLSAFISGWHYVDRRVRLWWVIEWWELFDKQSKPAESTAEVDTTTAAADFDVSKEFRGGFEASTVYPNAEPEDQRKNAGQSKTFAGKFVEFAAELASELDTIWSTSGFSWWWWEQNL